MAVGGFVYFEPQRSRCAAVDTAPPVAAVAINLGLKSM
jgi:hypothetical protein